MNMKSNVTYDNDSENEIIQKRSLIELNMWTSNLNYISEECDYLVKISSNKLKDRGLSDALLLMIEKKASVQNILLTYKNSADNFNECIDLDCDLFYYNEHEKVRNLYTEFISSYRKLKKYVFDGLLIEG